MKFTVSANLRKISVITAELQQIKTKVRFSYHYPIILLQHSCTWIHTAHSCHGRTDNNRKTQESQDKADGKQTLVPQKANTVRLCADDVLTREKLVAYHDSYAKAMEKYGLQRGIRGSEARHTTTAQYYRDLKRQTGELEANVQQLQTEQQQVEQQLDKVRKEIKSEKLEIKFLLDTLNFSDRLIKKLCMFKDVTIKGKLYSSEFRQFFKTDGSVCSLKETSDGTFDLKIDGVSHVSWFRRKKDEFMEAFGLPASRRNQNRGLKL